MTPDMARIMQAVEATWPPARAWDVGPFRVRDGQGGGQRVSAATAEGVVTEPELRAAEQAIQGLGQTPLFQCRGEGSALEQLLQDHGYTPRDETVIYAAPITALTDKAIPRVTAFPIWEPLAIMKDIWATDGIGPSRLAVMHRAACKSGILGRWNEKPAGAAFVGVHQHIAMVHGLVVLPEQRRQGMADWLMRAAAHWAAGQGAAWMAVLCVAANAPANGLYQSLGFAPVGRYHYRIKA
ncbi:MAG: GNAT family N-acetyltransferase [Pseudomonadota bacterium]